MKKRNILLYVSLLVMSSQMVADNPISALGRAAAGAVEGVTYGAGEVVESVGDVVPPVQPITDATGEVVKGSGRAAAGVVRVGTGNDYDDSYIYDNDGDDDVVEEDND